MPYVWQSSENLFKNKITSFGNHRILLERYILKIISLPSLLFLLRVGNNNDHIQHFNHVNHVL